MSEAPAHQQVDQELVARVSGFPIFHASPPKFIEQFVALTKRNRVAKGATILDQGTVNERFLVLLTGKVQVKVDGEQVAVLESPGDLMGEMSAINARIVTASLEALTDVEFLELSARQLNPVILAGKTEFGYEMYRLLCGVLSDKIIRTNSKARQFEITNRALVGALNSLKEMNLNLDLKVQERTRDLEQKTVELEKSYTDLEAQNSELIASHRKIEELYSTKALTFKKLSELYDTLTPLLQNVRELQASAAQERQSKFSEAISQLESSVHMLLPMTELYSTEQAIKSRRVLLAEPDRKQQSMAKLALGGTGLNLDIAATPEELAAYLASGSRTDLVFVSSELCDSIADIRQKLPNAKLVYMTPSNVPEELPKIKKIASQISNIVSRHPADRTFTIKNVGTTASKLISKDIFGLEKYMIWGVEVQERDVVGSAQRAKLIHEMQEYFTNLGVRPSVSERATLVAEEILMNAIYDAPTDENGKPLFNHLARTVSVDLKENQYSKFRFAVDGMLAAVSVSDPFGTFTMQVLIDYLERNYNVGAGDPQLAGKGGAGRGLHQITENSDLVVFNVKSKKCTEVIALFNLDTKSAPEGLNPSFHFFQE
jgi:CRP-like cAMP-binding protein